MAIIIETCPNCGHDLIDSVICTNPPIPRKSCPSCGWYWEGEREEIVRIPFGGNSHVFEKGNVSCPDNKYALIGSRYDDEIITSDHTKVFDNLATTVSNYYGNTFNATEAMEAFAKAVEDLKRGF